MHVCMLSRFNCVQLYATLWTISCQAPLSMRFSRQEYWSELTSPPPGDLPNPGIEPGVSQVSCIGRWVLYHQHLLRSSPLVVYDSKVLKKPIFVILMQTPNETCVTEMQFVKCQQKLSHLLQDKCKEFEILKRSLLRKVFFPHIFQFTLGIQYMISIDSIVTEFKQFF